MRVGVFGAGAIGCYLGGTLARGGANVVLVGRQRLIDAVKHEGLHCQGLDQELQRVPESQLTTSDSPSACSGCEIVLVTVKSGQSQEAGEALRGVIDDKTLVISFQNGVRNADTLRSALPDNEVLAGMVPFNVVWDAPAIFRQQTSGPLVLQKSQRAAQATIASSFKASGLPLEVVENVVAMQWGKLLMNLNNAINALAGIPLKEELSERSYRLCLAAAMTEALRVLQSAGIEIVSPLKVPLSLVPFVLRSPTPIFTRVAKAMLHVAPDARSSMWDDLKRGRTTEIDVLNGEIVQLAAQHDLRAPINTKIVALIREAETAGKGSPLLSSQSLRTSLGL